MSIRRHSFYNLTGSLASIAVTLITVPIYLRLIGTERYGVLVIVWIFLGYFGMFDLGLGRATAQQIASLHQAEPDVRAGVFWTALMLNTVLGVVGGVLLWPAAHYLFTTHFKITEALRLEVLSVIPWLAAAVPVATISGVLVGALQGREKFLALNASNVLGGVLYQVLPLSVAWLHGPDLGWLVPAALLGRVAVFLLLFTQCRRHVPLTMAPSVRRDLVTSLFRYGGWVTITSVISPLLTTLDRFLIGSISGAKAVTYYTLPSSLASRVSILPASLAETLFPRFSATSEIEAHRLTKEAVCALSVILTPIIIAGILIMGPFLMWWVGPEVARNASMVGEIIALGLWFNGHAYIPAAQLQAQGRPDLLAKCHLAEILPYLVLLVLALRGWGVVGAAFAWSMRMTVDAILLFWIARNAPFGLTTHLPPLLLLAMATVAAFVFPIGSGYRWALGLGSLLGALAWAWWAAPDSVKRMIRDGYQFILNSRS